MPDGTIRRALGIDVPAPPPPEQQGWNPTGVMVGDFITISEGAEDELGDQPITRLDRITRRADDEEKIHLWARYQNPNGRDNLVEIADDGEGGVEMLHFRWADEQPYDLDLGGRTFGDVVFKVMATEGFRTPDSALWDQTGDFRNSEMVVIQKVSGASVARPPSRFDYWTLERRKAKDDEPSEYMIILHRNRSFTLYRGFPVAGELSILTTGTPSL